MSEKTNLFRDEVIGARGTKLLGDISLARSLPLRIYLVILLAIVIAISAILYFGSYSRNIRVFGRIGSAPAPIVVVANQDGRVSSIYVASNKAIKKSQIILSVRTASPPISTRQVEEQADDVMIALLQKKIDDRTLDLLQQRISSLRRELHHVTINGMSASGDNGLSQRTSAADPAQLRPPVQVPAKTAEIQVLAPQDCVVLAIYVRDGDSVRVGDRLVELRSINSDLIATFFTTDSAVTEASARSTLQVHYRGFLDGEDHTMMGTIRSVMPELDPKAVSARDASSDWGYKVTVDLGNARKLSGIDENLRPSMPVEADIVSKPERLIHLLVDNL